MNENGWNTVRYTLTTDNIVYILAEWNLSFVWNVGKLERIN